MKEDMKLNGRDLINIGIYGAIYFVILFAVAMLGMIPIFLPLLSVCVTGTYLLTHAAEMCHVNVSWGRIF